MIPKRLKTLDAPKSNWMVYALLIAISIVIRIPFLKTFDLVTFDGTYYINQAKALWTNAPQPGTFPIGYPFFISLFLPVIRDGVRAAQVVSFLASLGSLLVFFHLCKQFLERYLAFCCTLFLAATPLFIRLSLETFSESTYLFWMLLALLFYAKGKDALTGLTGGVAAITRPEMIAVVGLLSLLRVKTPRRMLVLLASFAVIYSFNTLKFYQSSGEVTILPKKHFFGAMAENWLEREKQVDTKATASVALEGAEEPIVSTGKIITAYLLKLPHEFYTLGRNALFILPLLAVYGFYRKRSFLLVSLVPFMIGPLFTVRVADRYLLPYVPIVILYAFIGANAVTKYRHRQAIFVAIALAAFLGPFVNFHLLTKPDGEGFVEMKTAGLYLKKFVREGDKMADRKPYVAFYSGARYTAIMLQ